ncbi:MAG: hypothetical protein P8Y44_01785 [Acidobacteriota bacterium]
MKRVHQLRVEDGPERFEGLVSAAASVGIRIGWLEFASSTVSESLASASAAGVFRAVQIDDGVTVAVKNRKGPVVMRDLMREHFQGCSLILVSGGEAPAVLRSVDDRWLVSNVSGVETTYTTDELVAALRKVRPFGV